MPSLRQTSGTLVPSSACFRAKTICSSVNRDFFIGTTSAQGSIHHAGILFLNGAGFSVRVMQRHAIDSGLPIHLTFVLKIGLIISAVYYTAKAAYLVWGLGDIGVGLMAWLTIIAILLLRETAFTCLKNYEAQLVKGEDPVFHPETLGIKRADYWVGNRTEVNRIREATGSIDEKVGLSGKQRLQDAAKFQNLTAYTNWLRPFFTSMVLTQHQKVKGSVER